MSFETSSDRLLNFDTSHIAFLEYCSSATFILDSYRFLCFYNLVCNFCGQYSGNWWCLFIKRINQRFLFYYTFVVFVVLWILWNSSLNLKQYFVYSIYSLTKRAYILTQCEHFSHCFLFYCFVDLKYSVSRHFLSTLKIRIWSHFCSVNLSDFSFSYDHFIVCVFSSLNFMDSFIFLCLFGAINKIFFSYSKKN